MTIAVAAAGNMAARDAAEAKDADAQETKAAAEVASRRASDLAAGVVVGARGDLVLGVATYVGRCSTCWRKAPRTATD